MEEHKRELLDEAFGLFGMIREVMAKAALLKRRAKNKDVTLLEEHIEERVRQMHEDLTRYSERLEEIYQELSEYGDVYPMDGQPSIN